MRLTRNLALPLAILAMGAFANLSEAQNAPATVINQTYTGSFPATISGTLPNQNTVLEEAFNLASTSNVTAYTTSYATGGFEPSLTLYGPDGKSVASAVPGGPGATGTPALDVYLSQMGLSAGTYTLALMDYQVSQSLTATSLSDGFASNLGNRTTFVDENGSTRTGSYTIDLSVTPSSTTGGTGPSAVPEPGTSLLVLLPLIAVGALYSRRRNFATE